MPLPEPVGYFVDPLERAALDYCVTGSIASGLYGEPRMTRDVDVVLLLTIEGLPRFQNTFPEAEFYVPPVEVILTEMRRPQRGGFNLYHHGSGFKADVFLAARDPLHLWALRHRRRRAYDNAFPDRDLLWVAPPEYVIVRKLEYFREGDSDKHVRDIRFMLTVTEIDHDFLKLQIERLGLQEQWRIVQEMPPPD